MKKLKNYYWLVLAFFSLVQFAKGHPGKNITERINHIRKESKKKYSDQDGRSTRTGTTGARPTSTWTNWNNWGNWSNWNDWKNWGNWGNWPNAKTDSGTGNKKNADSGKKEPGKEKPKPKK